jgi:hypothetical protein
LALAFAATILITTVAAGILLNNTAGLEEGPKEESTIKLYTYPLSPYQGNGKVYVVTVETNWTSKPGVSLPEFDMLKYVSVDFGWSTEPVFFNVTVPTDLVGGNISLIRKYYVQSPDLYTLSNNGTHNSIWMTCEFTPYFSGVGHFEIRGTEAAW